MATVSYQLRFSGIMCHHQLALASGVFVNWPELSPLLLNATFGFSHGSQAHVKVICLLESFQIPHFTPPRRTPGPQPKENPSDLRSTASQGQDPPQSWWMEVENPLTCRCFLWLLFSPFLNTPYNPPNLSLRVALTGDSQTFVALGARTSVPGWYIASTSQGNGQCTMHVPTRYITNIFRIFPAGFPMMSPARKWPVRSRCSRSCDHDVPIR